MGRYEIASGSGNETQLRLVVTDSHTETGDTATRVALYLDLDLAANRTGHITDREVSVSTGGVRHNHIKGRCRSQTDIVCRRTSNRSRTDWEIVGRGYGGGTSGTIRNGIRQGHIRIAGIRNGKIIPGDRRSAFNIPSHFAVCGSGNIVPTGKCRSSGVRNEHNVKGGRSRIGCITGNRVSCIGRRTGNGRRSNREESTWRH